MSSAWLHRKCAGLSKAVFEEVCKSDAPFCFARGKLGQLELEQVSIGSQVNSQASKLPACDEVARIIKFARKPELRVSSSSSWCF